jgi:riboflavin synthase
MFTGIIQDIGTVEKIEKSLIKIKTKLVDIKVSDSISVNGVCLTITGIQDYAQKTKSFIVNISEETYNKTNLSDLKVGDKVNLEPAMKYTDKFGGHLVTGHIESTGRIVSISKNKNYKSKIFGISFPNNIKKYIVPKGSIAVDGISLTVTEIKNNNFFVSIIPYTLNNTVLGLKNIGNRVNLEPDIIAKYLDLLLNNRNQIENNTEKNLTDITWEFLREKGFL